MDHKPKSVFSLFSLNALEAGSSIRGDGAGEGVNDGLADINLSVNAGNRASYCKPFSIVAADAGA